MLTTIALSLVLGGLAGSAIEEDREPVALRLLASYPATLEEARALDPEAPETRLLMQTLSFAGREDLAAAHNRDAFLYAPCPADSLIEGDPMDIVMGRAQDAQIVIINESHSNPLHRHAITTIGTRLNGEGFELFAAEAFNHGAVPLEKDYLPDGMGFFTSEPIFARQLGALHEAGQTFIAYEIRPEQYDPEGLSAPEQIALREEAQANNFIEAVLADDPQARVLVHVGHDHLLKEPITLGPYELQWFASRLAEKTGIDPLTISQTYCGAPDEDMRIYATGPDHIPDGAVDLFLAQPDLTFEHGRPIWRREIGDIDTPVPTGLIAPDRATIIEARHPDAPLDSLAIERLLLYPGEALPLLLPPGTWRLDAFTDQGRYGDPVEVTAE